MIGGKADAGPSHHPTVNSENFGFSGPDVASTPSLKKMMYPACFPTEKLYREWLYLARVVRESSTICDDCTKSYEEKMKSIGRCHKDYEQQRVFARSLDLKQRIQSEQLDLLQVLFESQDN